MHEEPATINGEMVRQEGLSVVKHSEGISVGSEAK
jgi:hypothetical protein